MLWILNLWDTKGQVTEVTNLTEVWTRVGCEPQHVKGCLKRKEKGGYM